jgi:hypothetical protein
MTTINPDFNIEDARRVQSSWNLDEDDQPNGTFTIQVFDQGGESIHYRDDVDPMTVFMVGETLLRQGWVVDVPEDWTEDQEPAELSILAPVWWPSPSQEDLDALGLADPRQHGEEEAA